MKVHLLFPDQDPVLDDAVPSHSEALVRDLGLDPVFDQMAGGDAFLRDVAYRTILDPVGRQSDIAHRQSVLEDCLAHPDLIRTLQRIATDAGESKKRAGGWYFGDSTSSVLHRSVRVLEQLVPLIKQLRTTLQSGQARFRSRGLQQLCVVISHDLDEEYIAVLEDHLRRLRFAAGVVLTADLGERRNGTNFVLRKPAAARRSWRHFLGLGPQHGYTYRIPDRDEAGARALSEIRDRGAHRVADALAQATDHIMGFFLMLRWEVGFYVGCLNLHEQLGAIGVPVCFPVTREEPEVGLAAQGLYDVGLALRVRKAVVANDIDATGKQLVVVTGANHGGKSTFLRSIGLAQLMMQSGMFVAATQYRGSIGPGVHTHFKREEDRAMESGKLDEELARMSQIVERLAPGSLVLFNESFACTNEREGSRIAREIIDGLLGSGVRIAFVTHMFDLAHGLDQAQLSDRVFLRPERMTDGRRTFRIVPAAPMRTSHGQDLYERIFSEAGKTLSR